MTAEVDGMVKKKATKKAVAKKPRRPKLPAQLFVAVGPGGELPPGVARLRKDVEDPFVGMDPFGTGEGEATVEGPFVHAERVRN